MDVREVSRYAECLHAPVYFAPEPQTEYAALGLRGFWRGYFAGRAAALGSVGAEVVTELFGGFAPSMVARAIPAVWAVAPPDAVLTARTRGAAAALRRLLPGEAAVRRATAALDEVLPASARVGGPGPSTGEENLVDRCPLAAAHASVPASDDPWAALWQRATVLRELRGDVHLSVLRRHDLPWPQPHLLLLGLGRLDPRQREYRGFPEDEWHAAEDVLRARGLFGTDAGAELAETIDAEVDAVLAGGLVVDDAALAALRPLAVAAASDLPFPNAIGLPRPLAR